MTNNNFPSCDFDEWAETYDSCVAEEQFPFVGYQAVLNRIFSLAAPQQGTIVLDLGTGSGNLGLLFARAGCELLCTDFSDLMLAKARLKIPGAKFIKHDLLSPLPSSLSGPFDYIVSAYVFHHFVLEQKLHILRNLLPLLNQDGHILIGDIAFPDLPTLERVRNQAGDQWEAEFYWQVDDTLAVFSKIGFSVEYSPVSFCAGVFSFMR